MKAQTPMLWEKPVPVFIFPKPAKRFSAKEWIMLLKSIILLVNPHILRTRQNKAKWAFSVESPQKLLSSRLEEELCCCYAVLLD